MTIPTVVTGWTAKVGVWTAKHIPWLVGGALIFAAGLGLGYKIWHQKIVQETPALAVVHPDAAVTLARAPDAKAKPAQPKQDLPKGATVERIEKIVVTPKPTPEPAPTPALPGATTPLPPSPCPPVHLDLTVVKLPDGTQRVIASSPDGQVDANASVDIPVAGAAPPPGRANWGLGGVYGVGENGMTSRGALAMRRVLGPLWGQVEVTKDTYDTMHSGWSGRLAVVVLF